jgi:hypothetical protein
MKMNTPTLDKIEAYRRQELKNLLSECTEGQIMLFKRMYSHKKLELPIEEVVDKMPSDRIDWAIEQTERTLYSNATTSHIK